MKIICFSSHTATWYFAIAEAIIASALQKKGHNVLYITPGSQFGEISNLMQERVLREEFGLKGYEISATIDAADRIEIDSLVTRLDKNNFESLIIDNVEIGKMALYEILLHRKKMNLDFNQDEWKECLTYLKNAIISFFACRRIIKKEKPDRIIMYSTLYSVNRVWERYANLKGIPVYWLHHGLNFSDIDNTLIIAKNNPFYYINRLINIWSEIKNVPMSQEMLCYVTDHFFELLKAKHYLIYSSSKSKININIRKCFDIKENQKILTVTMSSYDEIFAAEYVGARYVPKDLIFSSQTEWVRAIIYYAKKRPDLFFIIRLHPREFPNKREGIRSEHSKIIEKEFINLPDNVKINWPTDNISIYDLAQETDVFLNAWSSVGVEMSLLGIPVVAYSKDLILYPEELNYVAKDRDDYFFKIEQALDDGWSYEKIKFTYRWLSLYYCRTVMRFRSKKGNCNQPSDKSIILKSKIINYVYNSIPVKIRQLIVNLLAEIPGSGIGKKQREDCRRQLTENVDISKMEKMLDESADTLVDMKEILAESTTNEEENCYIRKELKRLYEAMYGGQYKGENLKVGSLRYNLQKIIKE